MCVDAASFDQAAKAGYIQFVPAEGIELQIKAVRDQVRLGILLGFRKVFLQFRAGNAQALLRRDSGLFGPQQAQQGFERVRSICFGHQVNEQSQRFAFRYC
jgi:hypothetical protein